jgi:hypothetical protein
LQRVAWTTRTYTREEVAEAGRTFLVPLTSKKGNELALAVLEREKALAISNWRSAHGFPLNTLQMNLRATARQFDPDPTVAQRTKRLASIRAKLERLPQIPLDEMQDIGGCRAVVETVDRVREIVAYYEERSQIKHRLLRKNDYIDHPKGSGYRGVHLIYSYHSDRHETWNGLQIEMQVRSRLQHAWATAVETVGTFTRQALKSSAGDEEWLRFFSLMSSALALREGTPLVPKTPKGDPEALRSELRKLATKLKVQERMSAYGSALRVIETGPYPRKKASVLLELDIAASSIRLETHTNQLVAADAYAAMERAIAEDPLKDAVLVTVESMDALRRAYPNYFLDTSAFLASVDEATA